MCGFIPPQANTGFISRRQPNFQRGMANFRGNNFGGRNSAGILNGHYPMNFPRNSFPRVMGTQRGGNNFMGRLRPQHSYSRSQPGGSHGYSRRHIRDVTSNDVTHRRVRRQAMTTSQGSQHMTWNFHPDNRRRPIPQGAPGQARNSPKVILSANGSSMGPHTPSVVAAGQVRPSIVRLQSRTSIDPPYQVNDPQQAMLKKSRNSPVRQLTPQSAGRTGLTNTAPANPQTNNPTLANIGTNTNFLLDNFFPQMQPGLLSLGDNPLMSLAQPKNENGNAQNSVPKALGLNLGSKTTGPNPNTNIRNKPVLMAGNNRVAIGASQPILNNALGVSASNDMHAIHQLLPGNKNILQNLPGSPNGASQVLNLQTGSIGGPGQGSTMIKQDTFQPLRPNGGAVSSVSSGPQGQKDIVQRTRLSHQHPNGHGALHLPPNHSATMARVMKETPHGHTGMVHNSGVHPQSQINLHRGSKRIVEAHSVHGQGRVGRNQVAGSLQMNTENLPPHGTNQIPNAVSIVQTHGNPAIQTGIAGLKQSNFNPAINAGHESHRSLINPQLISNPKSAEPTIDSMQHHVSSMTVKQSQKARSPALGILPPKQTMQNQRLLPNLPLKESLTDQSPLPNLLLKQSLADQRQRPIPNLSLKRAAGHGIMNPDVHQNDMGAINSVLSGQGTGRNVGPKPRGLVHDQIFPQSVNQADIFQQIQGLTIKDLAKSNFTKDQILNALVDNFKTKDANTKRQLITQGSFKQNLGNGLAELTTNPSLRIQNTLNEAPAIPNTAINNQLGSSLPLGLGPEPILASLAELERLQLPDITRNGVPASMNLKSPASSQKVLRERTNSNVGKSDTFSNNPKSNRMSQSAKETRHGGLSSNNLNTNLRPNIINKDVLLNTGQDHGNLHHSSPQTRHFAGSSENVNSLADGSMLNNINLPHPTIPPHNNRINTFVQDKHMDIPTNTGMNNGDHKMSPPGTTGLGGQVLRPNDGAGMNSIVPVQQMTLPESSALHNTATFRQNVKSGRSNPKNQNAQQRPGSKPQLPGGVRVEHWLFSEMGKIMSSKAIQTTSTTTTTTQAPITTGRLLITQPNIPVPTAEQIASRNGRRPSRKIKTRGRRRRKKIRKRINRGRSQRILPSTTHAPRIIKASVDAINTTNTTNSKRDSRLKRRKINITKETRIVTRPIGPPVNSQTNVLLSQIMRELKKSATTPSPLNQDINHKLSQILDLLQTNSNPTNNPFGILATTAPPVDVLQLLGGAPNIPVGGASLGASLGNSVVSNQGQQNQLSPIEMLLMSNMLQGNAAPGQGSSLTQLLTGMGSNGAMTLGQNGTTPEQNMNSTLVQALVQQMMLNNDNNNNGCGCYPKSLGCPNELFPRNGRRWKHLINCNKDETRCCDDN